MKHLGWIVWCGLFLLFSCTSHESSSNDNLEASEAGKALDEWYTRRMDEHGVLDVGKWMRAFQQATARTVDLSDWKPLGPKNIGGRTLCVAFHPQNPDIVYAGSASGGLWVTKNGGLGPTAWERISTGYPVLGVSAILIDPADPDRMWIGTGEMYNQKAATPGTINRFTRGTYGIGILRSTDGGQTWSPSLDWTSGPLRSIQKIIINPLNADILYAGTSEGVYRSDDGGEQWARILDQDMVTDLWLHPSDTSQLMVAAGSFFTAGAGLYRTTNSGKTFNLIDDGIPDGYTGKAMFGPVPSDPDQLYCSVANAQEGIGLYHSNDRGQSWDLVNPQDIPKYQGWYSHALSVSPTDPDYLLYGGIDMHRSFNGGEMLIQVSYWEEWLFGKVPVGGPEGPPYYVHADIHEIQYNPLVPSQAWVASDGGLFVTTDDGLNFSGRNGGYQTQQFYARFSNSGQDADFAIGGMQDNATAIYEGDDAWVRVVGGDGLSTAIDPTNDQRVIASAQNLLLFRSLNKGSNFEQVSGSTFANESVAFNGPFQIDPKSPDRVFAGGQRLYRSNIFGALGSWQLVHPTPLDGSNLITNMEISPTNGNHLVVVTSSDPIQSGGVNTGKVRVSLTNGNTWITATGLPSRYCTDIAFHPLGDTLLATFGGFAPQNLYRSVNGGTSWSPWGMGLPEVPISCVVYDPYESRHVYAGTDLGVYFSADGGATWDVFSNGLPDGTLVMDLSISLPKQTIRAATHGLGVYESSLVSFMVATDDQPSLSTASIATVLHNPIQGGEIQLRLTGGLSGDVRGTLFDLNGHVVATRRWHAPGKGEAASWPISPGIGTGLYYLQVEQASRQQCVPVLVAY
ncbi:MAG: hypothetical protein K9I85_09165 [Saprospiraceae bacterium]|nr:hypothetical protein [Saprospiraceae bacterium]